MTVRRLARYRPHRLEGGRPSTLRRGLVKVALRLLDLVAVSIVILLVAAPFAWRKKQAGDAIQAWTLPRQGELDRMEADWMTLPIPPAFTRGDEPALRAFLQTQPLLVAIQSQSASKALWVRRGDALVKADAGPEARLLRQWFAEARGKQSFVSYPRGPLPGEDRAGPKLILRGDPWQVLKCWREAVRSQQALPGGAPQGWGRNAPGPQAPALGRGAQLPGRPQPGHGGHVLLPNHQQ
jgi:hypothetical protein